MLILPFLLSQTESYASEDELHLGLTEEQKLQKQLDAKNITVNLAVRGDGVNFPVRLYTFFYFFFMYCTSIWILSFLSRVGRSESDEWVSLIFVLY